MTILLTGATGTNGVEIARQLVAAGVKFKALVRSIDKRNRLPLGAEVVQGDLSDSRSLDLALEGVSRVLILSSVAQNQVDLQNNVVAAAKRAGLERIIKFSAMGADPSAKTALNKWHGLSECAIEESGIAFTHLRPNSMFQNIRRFKESVKDNGVIASSVGDGQISMVDLRDVAAVAVAALTTDNYRNEVLEITGPRAITYFQLAEATARALGRDISYIPLSDEDVRQRMIAAGTPAWAADVMGELSAEQRAGRYARLTATVECVTARTPYDVVEALQAIAPEYLAL
ncbi:SDR family oxidoreductase [Agrobacterium sp. 33MFTa1.1]|uniref:SDR family oxidoreductase n=1 Tax=Agrobacterium sp. 33MFTa1.1 TaxID=1279031 RepID=UPI00055374C8|nr:SDR family oxidoreductase [Agrobacterium sp. 33MFTa1.1]